MKPGLIAALFLVAVARPASADLFFPQTTLDMGELRAGVPASQSIPFTNNGFQPVEIVEMRPGCGCVNPRLTHRVVKPGEKGSVLLDFRTLGQPAGPHIWTIAVVTRSGKDLRETNLRVRATVVTEVNVEPAELTVHADGPTKQTITITDRRETPLNKLTLQTSSPRLRASLSGPTVTPEKHTRFTVTLDFAGDYPEGKHRETLTIRTSDQDYAELTVSLTLVKRPQTSLLVSPEELVFDDAGQRALRVRARNGDPVTIERVTADEPALSFVVANGPDGNPIVRVQVDRARLAGRPIEGTIRIETRQPAGQVLTVPVRAEF